jgi:predicted nucleic acid-binding protein
MKKIFVDADITLDLLAKREPFYNPTSELFSLIDDNQVKGYTSPIIIANIHYILSKQLGKEKSLKYISKLTTLLKILTFDEKIVELALSSDFKDFEDAIQYYTAIENNVEILITRNIKAYKYANIPIMTADEFITFFNNENC